MYNMALKTKPATYDVEGNGISARHASHLSCLKQSKVDKGSAHTGAGNETTFTVRALAMSKGIGTKGYPLGHR